MCDIKQEEEPSAGRKGTTERTERCEGDRG